MTSLLHEWDGEFEADSPEATAFTLWFHNAVRLLFSELESSLLERLLDTDEFLDAFLRITQSIVKMPYQSSYNDALCRPML